jgi:enoyl-CoA hydratase/carnithine racemase
MNDFLTERRGKIFIVTINRPNRMNSLMTQISREMAKAWDEFEKDDELAVGIITGTGNKAFSAGNDLKAAAEGVEREYVKMGFAGLTGRFENHKPVIAAVNGVAMGGGFELALACDLIVASENASFALSEPKVGAVAIGGGIHRLPRQIPLKLAMGMLLTGRSITANDAYTFGLVNEVVATGEALNAAIKWAEEIISGSQMSVRETKAGVEQGLEITSLERAFRTQSDIAFRIRDSHDYHEGARAFAEKRSPNWKGR